MDTATKLSPVGTALAEASAAPPEAKPAAGASVREAVAEIAHLKATIARLSEEKAHLLLISELIERLNPLAKLEDMIAALLRSLADKLGGRNIALYYWQEGELHYADSSGTRRVLPTLDDPVVAEVAHCRQFRELDSSPEETPNAGDLPPAGKTWLFPLTTGQELLGVIKLENLSKVAASLSHYLPVFFSHASLVLANELRGEALRAKTAELDGYFNNALDLFCIADTEGFFRKLNPAWETTLGYRLSELHGRRLFDFVHPDDQKATREALAQLIEQRPIGQFINRYRHRDGQWRWIEWRAQPAGTLIYAAARDITERRQAEEALERYQQNLERLIAERTSELRQARDAAEAANRMKSIFLANMSHELRTPLNAILGFAQVMERDPRLPEEQRDNLRVINRSGRHLLALINDVLEISRIEAGRIDLTLAPCDLHELLHGIGDLVRLRAQEKGLLFSLDIDPTLPAYIETDAGKLRQILLNLVTNAIKYTAQGSVTLRASARVDGRHADLSFAVSDTGPGIAEQDRAAIFQAFFQAEQGRRLGEGAGLGLAISQQYAQLLGGRLDVDSTLGQGSTFTLHFVAPVTEAPPIVERRAGRIVGLAPGQRPSRILVADDDANHRRLVEALLHEVGFEVHTVEDGQEAVKAFRVWHPDLICMDMRMPVMDGYQATRAIRDLPGGHRVRIVALTASAFLDERPAILAAGCDEVLVKPFEADELLTMLERLLGLCLLRVPDNPPQPTRPADFESLDRLPAELRAKLAQAAEMLDIEASRAIIEQIRLSQPRLASALAALLEGFRLDRILTLCRNENPTS